MKVYKVKVNGKEYVVEVESVEEVKASPESAPKAEPKPVKTTVDSTEGTTVKAPMQGTIVNVKVNVGDTVKRGDVLVVLEAMKLENDIVSPTSGIVKAILVEKGQSVSNQAPLVIIG
ncbi:MAG TPA: biotin/lipoyl-containing protein [Bacilli bacterium]